jgi:putative endonuclease
MSSTRERGNRGEDRAADALLALGYRIIERNFRCRAGEIDIIARDGDTLVFVEVRTRGSARTGSAVATVNAAKQARLARVAQVYLSVRRPTFETCRFDVIGITADELTHIQDAFRLS